MKMLKRDKVEALSHQKFLKQQTFGEATACDYLLEIRLLNALRADDRLSRNSVARCLKSIQDREVEKPSQIRSKALKEMSRQ